MPQRSQSADSAAANCPVCSYQYFFNARGAVSIMTGCSQCGECCRKYGMRLEATPLDIARWTVDRREDILSRVGIERVTGPEGSLVYGEVTGGVLWVDADGRHASRCPFFELRADGKCYCGIQETKPEVCKTHWCKRYLEDP